MRLVGRILLVLAGASLPAVVAGIGCNVDSQPYPGISNEIAHGRTGGGGPSGASGATSSGSGSSSSGGGNLTLCQCAWSFEGHGDAGACTTCGNSAVATGKACHAQSAACTNDTLCVQALTCVVTCPDSDLTCTAGCIGISPVYQALVTCQCSQCGNQCLPVMPLPCMLGDAGAGDAGDAAGG